MALSPDEMRRCLMLIHTILSEPEWSADTPQSIAEVLLHFGFPAEDYSAGDYDLWESYSAAILQNPDNWKRETNDC